jgi:lactobin A/cerein 7B family class IIb bacteriocin
MKKLSMEQMVKIEGGKMPCAAALGFYAAGFIGAALATGGVSLLVGVISMGGSIWGVIESC